MTAEAAAELAAQKAEAAADTAAKAAATAVEAAAKAAKDAVEVAAAGLATILTELHDQVLGLRQDVAGERKGRRSNQWLGRLAIGCALIVGSFFAVDYVQTGRVTCATRIDSRVATRRGINAAADEVALFAHATAKERAELNARVEKRVLAALPDPC